jgi:TIR domain
MPRICLSYRRADSGAFVGRIYDRLVGRYGADAVFMDVNDIPYGVDFREQIQSVFRDAKVMIAVIGPNWLDHKDKPTRIHEPTDPVRVEIQTALRQHIFIIPILIDQATMPSEDDLPQDIKEFAFRNAMRVDPGVDFPLHIKRLMTRIDQVLGLAPNEAATATITSERAPVQSMPKRDATAPPTLLARIGAWCSRLLPYFLVPIVLLLLVHYLIVIELDTSPLYLRCATIVIPIPCGFLLSQRLKLGLGPAVLVGLTISVVAASGMTTIVGFIDGHSILPSNTSEWQESFEYVVTITLATAAGNLVARLANTSFA